MLIGLTGPARSGKDTICKMIQDHYDPLLIVKRDAFADRLKVSAAHALGYDDTPEKCVEFCNRLKEPGSQVRWFIPTNPEKDRGEGRSISGREFLQRYGTEAHREVFDQDFWVKALLPQTEFPYGHQDEFDVLVVTDVRFDNEAQRIKDCGGQIWKVMRPESGIKESSHSSEQPISDEYIDHFIVNDGTLVDLRKWVTAALSGATV